MRGLGEFEHEPLEERLRAAIKLVERLENRQEWLEHRARTLSASVAELSFDSEILQSRGNKIAHFAEIIKTARQDGLREGISWLGKNLGIYNPKREPRPDIDYRIAEAIFSLADEYEDF